MNMRKLFFACLALFYFNASAQTLLIDGYPEVESGDASAGKRVSQTLPEYDGTEVHHTLYLPTDYNEEDLFPVIVELTGNKWQYGNGTVEEAHLGYSVSLGKDFIWVVPPYVAVDGTHNEVTWWGSEEKTVDYLKNLVKYIIENYNADPKRIFLTGFSRGSIGVSYIGLYDDDISKLWCGFLSHDHFDGQREWAGTYWGSPLEEYRKHAAERLKRVNDREWYVSFNGTVKDGYASVIEELGVGEYGKYIYAPTTMSKCFPEIPNQYFESAHNDCWPAFDLFESARLRQWLYKLNNSICGTEAWKYDNVVVEGFKANGLVMNSGTDEQSVCVYIDDDSVIDDCIEMEYVIDSNEPVKIKDDKSPYRFNVDLPADASSFRFKLISGGIESVVAVLSKEKFVSAELTDSLIVCNEGETVAVPVYMRGDAPWSLNYSFNGEQRSISDIKFNPYIIKEVVNNDCSIELSGVSDSEKNGTVSGSVKIKLSDSEISPLYDTFIKENQSSSYSGLSYAEIKTSTGWSREAFYSFDLEALSNADDALFRTELVSNDKNEDVNIELAYSYVLCDDKLIWDNRGDYGFKVIDQRSVPSSMIGEYICFDVSPVVRGTTQDAITFRLRIVDGTSDALCRLSTSESDAFKPGLLLVEDRQSSLLLDKNDNVDFYVQNGLVKFYLDDIYSFIELYSIDGMLIDRFDELSLGENVLDLSSYNSGIYLICLEQRNGNILNRKIII